MKQNNSLFAQTLLAWFRMNGRDLPWRHTQDPYAIWLSEIILQQTRIAQGMEYWLRFMQKWSCVDDLAAATEDEVMRMWQGLGYYSRARNLHTAAQQIVALGRFPDTLDAIRQLKGVGDYTAAAIGSFAFGIPAAAVDGNFYRVLARYFGIDTPINTTEGRKLFASLAEAHLPEHEAADYNQAMMDFGATQCVPKSPACELCPLEETCVARREDSVDRLPVKLKTVKVVTRRLSLYYIRCNGRIAIHKRGSGDIWQGLWTVPEAEHLSSDLKATALLLQKDVKHVLTHRILLADFYLIERPSRPSLPPDFIWIKEEEIENYAIPRLMEKLISLPQPLQRRGVQP